MVRLVFPNHPSNLQTVGDNITIQALLVIASPLGSLKDEHEGAEQSGTHASCTIKHQSSILSSEVAIRVYALISPRGKRRC